MEHEELIQHYFKKTLSKKDMDKVLQLKASDLEFETKFNDYEDVQNAFKLNEKAALRIFLNTIDQKSPSFYNKFINPKVIAIAIASCAIIGFFYFNSLNTPSNLYNSYYDSYPNVYQPIVRGDDANENTTAFEAYENGKFLKAEKAFKTLSAQTNDDNLLFYYAMSLLNQNKLTEASQVLETLKTKNHEFLAEVYWYSALIDVKNNNYDKAIQNLNNVKKINKDFKNQDIEQLLNSIK